MTDFLKNLMLDRKRGKTHIDKHGGAEGRERESQADSGAWSTMWGSISQSQNHDLSQNHELDA